MDSPTGKRDVVRLRTFAEDAEHARAAKGISKSEAIDALPKETPTKESGVFFSVKKRTLELKDEPSAAAPLDNDGVTFDEETASQVSTQVYEENQAIKDAAKKKEDSVEIRQTDALDVIQNKSTAITPPADPTVIPTIRPTVTVPKPISTNPKPPANIPLESKETIDKIAAPTTSVFADENVLHGVTLGETQPGQFVTDKKRDRFKLVPAIGEAVSDWFTDTKEQIEEARREKHTVSPVASRVETIQAAAQAKTLAQGGDFEEVAERLRQTKKVVNQSSPVLVKPKSEMPVASWTHIIEDEGETASSTSTNTTATPVASASVEANVTSAEAVGAQTTETILTPTNTQTAASLPGVNEAQVETLSKRIPTQSETVTYVPSSFTLESETAVTTSPRVPEEMPAIETPRAVVPGRQTFSAEVYQPARSPAREFFPSPLLALAVVVIAIIAGVGTSMYFFGQPKTEEVTIPTTTTNPLFTAELQVDVALGQSHQETMNQLLANVTSNPSTLYMYLTREGNSLEPIPPLEVMNFLAPQAPGSFVRSVTNLSFGAYGDLPFIILKTNNFDSAFSGMLAWEQTMSADLAPLFGPVITESFDAQARTDSQTRSAYFKDIVVNNQSGRVLTNATGEDGIIYTFIDKQTILITTDRLQLMNILPLIR